MERSLLFVGWQL